MPTTPNVHIRPGVTYREPEKIAAVIAALSEGDSYTVTETSRTYHEVTSGEGASVATDLNGSYELRVENLVPRPVPDLSDPVHVFNIRFPKTMRGPFRDVRMMTTFHGITLQPNMDRDSDPAIFEALRATTAVASPAPRRFVLYGAVGEVLLDLTNAEWIIS